MLVAKVAPTGKDIGHEAHCRPIQVSRGPTWTYRIEVHMPKKIAVVLFAVVALASARAQTATFFQVARNEPPEDVQAAIEKGADVNARDEHGMTPLMYAALSSLYPGVIFTLIRAGADMNARDVNTATLLMLAAEGNGPEMITALVDAGLDVNAQDKDGWTALMFAAVTTQRPVVVTTLLQKGASAKMRDKAGYTALDYAQDNEYLKGTEALRQLKEASK